MSETKKAASTQLLQRALQRDEVAASELIKLGQVSRAKHALLKRPTAIKLLKPELVDKASIARFEREAQLASQLTHPNTIEIFDFGVTPLGLFYYVMEHIDGPSFAELVKQHGPIPPARTCHLLQQVCGSLIEAHDAFFLLTGRDVFESQDVADVLYQVMNVEPQRPSELRPDVPAELDQLVVDCLAKQPEDRPESVKLLLDRLTKMRFT